jgi:DNA-binding beta-propeller fold protein YncE
MMRARRHPGRTLVAVALLAAAGCGGSAEVPDAVWGRRGTQDGDMVRPRAIAIDRDDRVFIVDFTARIQVYSADGQYRAGWSTPDYRNGRPSGLSIDRDGHLIVSDSHYHCFRIYDADGTQLRCVGGQGGSAPGQLGYISDVVQDAEGFFYVAEFGENQRITKLDAAGKFIHCWGSPGTGPGQFQRARALALGPDGLLYVADACNHRIQVFRKDGELVRMWGHPGSAAGELAYPYDLAFAPDGNLFVVEYGNQRVQRFTPTGASLGCWCGPGRAPGQLHSPWAVAVDRLGRVFVVDTENHRVQRFHF